MSERVLSRVPIIEDNKQLDNTFAALANETRRSILAHLAQGEASVNELAEPFNLSLPAVSRHIRVLENAGLISQGQRAQYRPCRLDAEPVEQVANWADQYRTIWEERLNRTNDHLQALQSDGRQSNKSANRTER